MRPSFNKPIWKPICNKPCGGKYPTFPGRWPESGKDLTSSRPVQGRWPEGD